MKWLYCCSLYRNEATTTLPLSKVKTTLSWVTNHDNGAPQMIRRLAKRKLQDGSLLLGDRVHRRPITSKLKLTGHVVEVAENLVATHDGESHNFVPGYGEETDLSSQNSKQTHYLLIYVSTHGYHVNRPGRFGRGRTLLGNALYYFSQSLFWTPCLNDSK